MQLIDNTDVRDLAVIEIYKQIIMKTMCDHHECKNSCATDVIGCLMLLLVFVKKNYNQ